ncbi:cytochrome P450 [Plantactinospora solaniradicis]|uniref:Cytochrome P450 n=1 Tax=Plantactinospora solaniradicis TaxID=1723736 RepID=A0ABW1K9W2_9ACTN
MRRAWELLRDTHQTLIDIGNESRGDVVRLELGVMRPFWVTNPVHAQEVLGNRALYPRGQDTPLWRSVGRLVGRGILSEGDVWHRSRKTLGPIFRPTRMPELVDDMSASIYASVAELDEPAQAGTPVDISSELSRIVAKAVMRVFFADQVSVPDALKIMKAQETIVTAMAWRLLLPNIPWWIQIPGDKQFKAAVRSIDEILLPAVREAREKTALTKQQIAGDDPKRSGDDVLSTLAREDLSEQQVRDDVVAMVAVTTETTHVVLSWLFPLLAAHPDIADRLYEEIGRVVGRDRVRAEHLPQLPYTKMVLEELLRLYPAGWIVPRIAAKRTDLGGVRIPKGSTVVVSPFTTQRMRIWWGSDAETFNPDRWRVAERGRIRTRESVPDGAHFPFGSGDHVCLGMHLFNLEALLIVATVLSRFRFTLTSDVDPGMRVAASLRPRQRVEVRLHPIHADVPQGAP